MIDKAPRDEPFGLIVPPRLRQRRIRNGVYRVDEDGILEKRCGRCREYWPADTWFFFIVGTDLATYCRACSSDLVNKPRHPPIPVALPTWPVPRCAS
jgi:hypothetical protein